MDRSIEFISNHWILAAGLAVVTFLLLQDLIDSFLRKYNIATPLSTIGLLDNDDTIVLDVREPPEYARGFIERSLHIPIGKLDERISEVMRYKSQPVVVTCQTGTRSPQACKKLYKLGFEQVYLLRGGIQAWEDQNLPIRRKRRT